MKSIDSWRVNESFGALLLGLRQVLKKCWISFLTRVGSKPWQTHTVSRKCSMSLPSMHVSQLESYTLKSFSSSPRIAGQSWSTCGTDVAIRNSPNVILPLLSKSKAYFLSSLDQTSFEYYYTFRKGIGWYWLNIYINYHMNFLNKYYITKHNLFFF